MGKILLRRTFWALVILLSAYYLYRGIKFRFLSEGNLDEKPIWYYSHLLAALLPLLLGPFQFWTWLRIKHTSIHRRMGKIYIAGSLLGGLTALYLGITIDLQGSVLPLIFLSSLWLFMTICAWIAIKKGNIIAHRLFMIRSYGLALVFVFLRILGDIPQDKLFYFIASPELRDTTLEWISWIIPLLTIEIVFAWIPSLRQTKRIAKK